MIYSWTPCKGKGCITFLRFGPYNKFGGHLHIMPRNVYDCSSMKEGYVIIFYRTPRARVGEGDTASQDKNFLEIWVLKLWF